MEMNRDLWNELFEIVEPVMKAKSRTKTTDPIEDLKSNPTITIRYQRKVKQNAKSAFMVMSRGDTNWLTLLLDAILASAYTFGPDIAVMIGPSTAKPRNGKQQSWETFVRELKDDKSRQGQDYSEGQLRHLPNLLADLSGGIRFKGYGTVEFVDDATGEVLV